MDIWFGLVGIKALKGNNILEGVLGAYTNVACRATSKEDFISKINHWFKEKDFEVFEIDDIEHIDNLTIGDPESSEKLDLLNNIVKYGYDCSWGTYHTFDEE